MSRLAAQRLPGLGESSNQPLTAALPTRTSVPRTTPHHRCCATMADGVSSLTSSCSEAVAVLRVSRGTRSSLQPPARLGALSRPRTPPSLWVRARAGRSVRPLVLLLFFLSVLLACDRVSLATCRGARPPSRASASLQPRRGHAWRSRPWRQHTRPGWLSTRQLRLMPSARPLPPGACSQPAWSPCPTACKPAALPQPRLSRGAPTPRPSRPGASRAGPARRPASSAPPAPSSPWPLRPSPASAAPWPPCPSRATQRPGWARRPATRPACTAGPAGLPPAGDWTLPRPATFHVELLPWAGCYWAPRCCSRGWRSRRAPGRPPIHPGAQARAQPLPPRAGRGPPAGRQWRGPWRSTRRTWAPAPAAQREHPRPAVTHRALAVGLRTRGRCAWSQSHRAQPSRARRALESRRAARGPAAAARALRAAGWRLRPRPGTEGWRCAARRGAPRRLHAYMCIHTYTYIHIHIHLYTDCDT
jgi:hypothetical protein